MSGLDQLLEVQQHDTRIDQVRHRMATLPERAALAEAEAAKATLERAHAIVADQRQALGAEQDRLEREIATAKERRAVADGKLYGGVTSVPRELQALQDEIASLTRRIGLLEDSEIEIMEQLEPVDAQVAEQTAALDQFAADIDRLGMEATAAEAELAVELESTIAARAAATVDVPEELMTEYEFLRTRSGGIGIAKLIGGQCGGCHLRQSAVELDRIKKLPPDSLIHCEECGRMLVP